MTVSRAVAALKGDLRRAKLSARLAATVAAMSSCAVRRADEAGFVERRREVDAAVEHGVEEAVEALLVGRHHRRRSSAAARRRRRSRTCRLRSRPTIGTPAARAASTQAVDEAARPRRAAPRRSRAWRSRAASPGRRRSRPGCPTACRPGRPAPSGASCSITARLPPKAASGMPPPITLPNTLRSGAKPGIAARVEALRAAERDAKAGHHLVEDEQRAVLRCTARAGAA